MTWADYNDIKGFHILDLETLELEFIPNPYKLFQKIVYDDAGKEFEQIFNATNFSQYKDCYVKIVVKTKTNPFWYDQFVQRLEDAGVAHLQAVDDHLNISLEVDEDIINEAESTLDILKKSIKGTGLKPETEASLEQLLHSLYVEANLMQS